MSLTAKRHFLVVKIQQGHNGVAWWVQHRPTPASLLFNHHRVLLDLRAEPLVFCSSVGVMTPRRLCYRAREMNKARELLSVMAASAARAAARAEARAEEARKEAAARAVIYAPPTSYPLSEEAAAFRNDTYHYHPCLARIIDLEDGMWDPTIDYGGGHGNVYEAYGLPQAYPGTKMSSAGSDWQTSRETQLRWMHDYAVERFGSECGAWYSRSVHGSY
jgi:hypothetical protein